MKYFFFDYLKKMKTNFLEVPEVSVDSWPESWKKIEYKEYRRFPKILLEFTEMQSIQLKEVLDKRNSVGMNQEKEVSFSVLSNILNYSGGIKEKGESRFYPSGGARFPLEMYLFANEDVEGLKKGIYHYNVKENCLEFMWEGEESGENYIAPGNEKWKAKVYIVITSVIERSSRKYGELAFKYSYLETGALMQNILLLATAHGVSNSIVNFDDTKIEKELEIDGETEFVTGVVAIDFEKIYE